MYDESGCIQVSRQGTRNAEGSKIRSRQCERLLRKKSIMRAVVNPFAHLLVGDLVLSSKKCLAVKLVLFVVSSLGFLDAALPSFVPCSSVS